jgi:hypothetical protein
VPIEGRTVFEASLAFSDYLNRLLNTTLTRSRIQAIGPEDSPRVHVTFRENGSPTSAQLYTKYGPITLYLGQYCEGVRTPNGMQRLITVEYTYTITLGDRDAWATTEPLLRWEYVRRPERDGLWCRHHLQGPVPLPLGRAGDVPMNDLHLPTGYVPIEEIIRFCLVDLDVRPLSDDWPRILDESYARFREELVGPPR